MKATMHQQEPEAFHVRVFSQAEMRCLMVVAVVIGIAFDLFR